MSVDGALPAYPDVSFEHRMGSVEFRVHERPHITVDDRKCAILGALARPTHIIGTF